MATEPKIKSIGRVAALWDVRNDIKKRPAKSMTPPMTMDK